MLRIVLAASLLVGLPLVACDGMIGDGIAPPPGTVPPTSGDSSAPPGHEAGPPSGGGAGDAGTEDAPITSKDAGAADAPSNPADAASPSADAGSGTPVSAPLQGQVTPGTWQAGDISVPGVTLPSGKPFHYDYLLPAQYDPHFTYPILVHEHEDTEGDAWYDGNDGDPLYLASASGADAWYVPVFAVSGANDGTSRVQDWNQPMWTALAGSSSYPGPPAGSQAPSSAFDYLQDPGLGHDVWDTYRPLPAGKPLYDWLFSQ